MFESFLLQLAKVLDFSSLAPDQHGACLIVMNEGNIPLLFELDEQIVPHKVLVSTPVVDFPLQRRAEIYEECLKINCQFEATASVKPDEDMLYLHRRLSPDIHSTELDLIMQAFLKQVGLLKEKVENTLRQPPKRPTIPPSPSSIEVFPYKA